MPLLFILEIKIVSTVSGLNIVNIINVNFQFFSGGFCGTFVCVLHVVVWLRCFQCQNKQLLPFFL